MLVETAGVRIYTLGHGKFEAAKTGEQGRPKLTDREID
jgi:hypothetical protein